MIPASYFFRATYRDHFEESARPEAEPSVQPGYRVLDRISASILGFAYGAAHLPLYFGAAAPHDRRR